MYLKLKEFYELILEGGAAFENVSSFEEADKEKIKENVSTLLEKMKLTEYSIVGSFEHKTEYIGDIDVVVVSQGNYKFSFDTMEETYDNIDIVDRKVPRKHETKKSPTLGVLSVKVPIGNKRLQMDVIPVPTLEWGEFSFYGPSEKETNFKGLYRNAMFEAIAKAIHFDVETDEDGGEQSYWRYRYLRNSGIWKVKEVNVGKTVYRYEKKKDTYTPITHDPVEVIKKLMGVGTPRDFMTFDDVWEVITNKKWKHYDLIENVLENFEIIIVERQKNDLPDIVKQKMITLGLKDVE